MVLWVFSQVSVFHFFFNYFYFGDLKIILFNLYVSQEGGYNSNFEGVEGVLISVEAIRVFMSFYNS